ncbi:unnamed protein product, partial [Mesorhabditis belari]|uniref:Alpha N-terminal protein methyltransferase 1 n=1 Tax=Mesorhabditis belari TaxID=2138241 RepID=A0AAF3FG28_9BILA
MEGVENENVYGKAEEYWKQASADVDGMLGGFAHLHTPDIKDSKAFIQQLKKKNLLMNMDYALDCGAGIGRVTKHLLMPLFGKVDMEDVVDELIKKSDDYIGNDARVGQKFVEGLQTFTPPEGRYDLIWIQWVSGHLTDSDFIEFFQRCKQGLRPGGCIVLKDNLAGGEKDEFDEEDHSWTRPEAKVLNLFTEAGLQMAVSKTQTGFPKGMYKVKMFALK